MVDRLKRRNVGESVKLLISRLGSSEYKAKDIPSSKIDSHKAQVECDSGVKHSHGLHSVNSSR